MTKSVVLTYALFLFALVLIAPVDALRINEIMYSPTDSLGGTSAEWIEVYNPDGAAVDISGWKILDPSDHSITGDTLLIPPGGYFVISKTAFFDNFSNYYSLPANAKAGFGLNNGGELVLLVDSNGTNVSSVDYSSSWGASGNGNSLQYSGSSWCEGSPTPGVSNSCSEGSSSNSSSSPTNTSQSTTSCTAAQAINVTSYPEDMEFGDEGEVHVDLNASCYPYEDVKFIVYGSPDRVVTFENGTKITSYASCQGGVTYRDLEEKIHSLKIKFFTYPNCDDYYAEDKYSVSIRTCYPEWGKYAESEWVIDISGKNESICGSDQSSDGDVDEEEDEAEGSNDAEDNSSDSTEVSLTGESVRQETLTNAGESAQNGANSGGETIYESESYKVKNISLSLMGMLFLLLLVYVLISKGKV